MNALVENGFVAALNSLAWATIPVIAATRNASLPSSNQVIVVQCTEVEHVAGPLHTATVRLLLRTNAHDNLAQTHANLARQMNALIVNATAFNSAASPLEIRGLFIKNQSESRDDSAWVSTVELVAGIAH
jgi:hypothetical protein